MNDESKWKGYWREGDKICSFRYKAPQRVSYSFLPPFPQLSLSLIFSFPLNSFPSFCFPANGAPFFNKSFLGPCVNARPSLLVRQALP